MYYNSFIKPLKSNNIKNIYNKNFIFTIYNNGDDIIIKVKGECILLILLISIGFSFCGAVTAHPGHGTPIEVPTDTGTDDTADTTVTDSSVSTSGSSQSSSSSGSTSSGSTSTGSSSKPSSSTTGGTSSDQTTTDTQTTDNSNATTTSTSGPEEVNGNTGSSTNSPGGPIAMIGLMVVIGLIGMSFPYKKDGTLGKLQMSLFGR